ncbi:hypothetical protein [Caenimonas sp. SL110]|uniref:hypothetical protein n=1 Tax=Caenimonas sp. SL110 TaxID=1450524 RepID=UPI000653B639|nr:hypothetical protein [Caenimonas sp. SL110]
MNASNDNFRLHPGLRPTVGIADVRSVSLHDIHAPAPDDVVQAPQASGLRGRQIRIGDGVARNQTLSLGQKAWTFFKTAMKPIGFVVAAPLVGSLVVALGAAVVVVKSVNLVGRLANQYIFEPRAERKYRQANRALITELEKPRPGSVLQRTGIASSLHMHAIKNGDRLSREEIEKLVAMGENIAAALQHSDGSLPLFFNGFPVTSNTYTTRALAWYLMATAASQDLDRKEDGLFAKTSDMVSAGSILLKDPGGKIYNFKNSAPTSCSRMSTHFAERTLPGEKHKALGFIPTGKPRQRGIEDYASKLPGEGGSMLFDRLQDDVLFIKIEEGGCPPYFQQEPGQGVLAPLAGICRFFHALDRNVDHSISFATTKLIPPSSDRVVRQEHLHKGALKATVDNEFNCLVQDAIANGIIQDDAKAIGKSAHRFGLPYVNQAIRQIREQALRLEAAGTDATRCQAVIRQCDAALALTSNEAAKAGVDRGIERKAFEVHITLPDFGPGKEGISAPIVPPSPGTPEGAAFRSMTAANLAFTQFRKRSSRELAETVVRATGDFAAYKATGSRNSHVDRESWAFRRQLAINLKPSNFRQFLAWLPVEQYASFSADLRSLNLIEESKLVARRLEEVQVDIPPPPPLP